MIDANEFRSDLYYRLNVVNLEIPPLRERKKDIIPLAQHFLNQFNTKFKTHKTLSPYSCKTLEEYNWPGNVRELNNLVERVSLLLHQGVPEKEAFQAFYNEWQKEEIPSPEEKQIETAGAIIDREAVLAALRRNGGNASRTAKELGISRSTLYRRLK